MISTAAISDCETYRYSLTREWEPGPGMLFVMLNPSTADASKDDPTIRRCIGFAKREGMGSIEVVNLFAFRATKPADLLAADDPIGPENMHFVEQAVRSSNAVVAAWGAWWEGLHVDRRPARLNVERVARYAGRSMVCLGTTKAGSPRHPLYVKGDQPLVPFE